MKGHLLLVSVAMFQNVLSFTQRRILQSSSRSINHLVRLASTKPHLTTTGNSNKSIDTASSSSSSPAKLLNLSTVTQEDLTTIVTSWGHPKFRANQIWQWIRVNGVTDVEAMSNIPKKLRAQLQEFSQPSSLQVALEQVSKDGTIKRAYRCHDGQLIESVLMPYEDGRYTACISSQAGCAQGCVFCATGQQGFFRQLSSEEIFEQVARFSQMLQQKDNNNSNDEPETNEKSTHGKTTRLSNIVMMGMGEPLANYRQVKTAVQRINKELGIGARRITISTVGIVPNIRKLYQDPDMPPVRLAVSLHCATDEERSALLPANRRYGGLDELMGAIKEYQENTGSRVTLEWALIEGTNDSVSVAQSLGKLVSRYGLRRDMVHVNVIPLNPTGGYGGSPSGRQRVNEFCQALEKEFGIKATPRVRRGIDIDAGCGQLKATVETQKSSSELKNELLQFASGAPEPRVGVYEDDDEDDDVVGGLEVNFVVEDDAVDFDIDEFDDYEYITESERDEADRLINLVKGTTVNLSPQNQDAPKRIKNKQNR